MKRKYSPDAKPKIKRLHPWRGWRENPPRNERTEFNHPALPSKLSRPI